MLKRDVVEEVSKLKQEQNGEIVVPASFQLLHTLIEHDLVDELRLMISDPENHLLSREKSEAL